MSATNLTPERLTRKPLTSGLTKLWRPRKPRPRSRPSLRIDGASKLDRTRRQWPGSELAKLSNKELGMIRATSILLTVVLAIGAVLPAVSDTQTDGNTAKSRPFSLISGAT